MNTKEINQDTVFAKILALSIIYAKEESSRRVFLERILYSSEEITAVIDAVCDDFEFRSWIQSAIPVMQCK